MNAIVGLLLATMLVTARGAEPPNIFDEYEVEMSAGLRALAGPGASASARVRVTVASSKAVDGRPAPRIMIVSATTDRGYNASRRLLRRYAESPIADGWLLVAADAMDEVVDGRDDVGLRLALNMAAVAALEVQHPETRDAPLAFGGFSGGAKVSGWLAAAFASQGRSVVGLYLAGINEDTAGPAATRFGVVDTAFRHVPIVLQSGRDDDVATPADHRDVASRLKRDGFDHVRIQSFRGGHEVNPESMSAALTWFDDSASSQRAPIHAR